MIGRSPAHTLRCQRATMVCVNRSSAERVALLFIRLFLGAVKAAIVIAIVILQNTQSEKITFLVWTAHVAVAGALLLAAGLSALLAFLITYGRQRQFRRAVRREHKLHNA